MADGQDQTLDNGPSDNPQRKYALTKIAAGDYLLPSNDGLTLWRITVYQDGPSSGVETDGRDRDWWGLWRWHQRVAPGVYIDTADWTRWEFCDGRHETRAEAIKAALNAR